MNLLVGTTTALALVLTAAPAAANAPRPAHDPPPATGFRVVATGLDNPRQLNWSPDGRTLVIAEAGSGGASCFGEGEEQECAGLTGAVSLVPDPGNRRAAAKRVLEGLFSVAGPDGSFAVGSNGADLTDVRGRIIVAETSVPPTELPPGSQNVPGIDQLGYLLVAEKSSDVSSGIIRYANIQAAETKQNPDGAQIDSNPYAVLFIDPTPRGPSGQDGYALVADAAANTVWKIVPDFSVKPPASCQTVQPASTIPTECLPPYQITPFVTYPTTALPNGQDDPNGPAEFVPTALAQDKSGNIYVGGLGSERPGQAQVVKYSPKGKELRRWTGFTAVTGVAVDDSHLYVSQLFGPTPPSPPGATPAAEAPPATGATPGTVVRISRQNDNERVQVDVPLPAGLAVGYRGEVYAAVNSVAPAKGISEGPFGPVSAGAVWELDFTNARPAPPIDPAANPAPDGSVPPTT